MKVDNAMKILLTGLIIALIAISLGAQNLKDAEILVMYPDLNPGALKCFGSDSLYKSSDTITLDKNKAARYVVPAGMYEYQSEVKGLPPIFCLPGMCVIADLGLKVTEQPLYYHQDVSFRLKNVFLEYDNRSRSLWIYIKDQPDKVWQVQNIHKNNCDNAFRILKMRINAIDPDLWDIVKYELDFRAGLKNPDEAILEIKIPIVTIDVTRDTLYIEDSQTLEDLRAKTKISANYREMIELIRSKNIDKLELVTMEGRHYVLFSKKKGAKNE